MLRRLSHPVRIPFAVVSSFPASAVSIAATPSRKRPKRKAGVIAGFLMAFAVSGCGLSGPAHSPPPPNVTAVVDLGFMSYSPVAVTIRAGDTVEWRNTKFITHTVTDDPRRAEKQGDAGLPAEAQIFDSGDIAAGQVYLRTFTIPGTYRYYCTYHEAHGMVGTVVVRPGS
jgi:plastocyanin